MLPERTHSASLGLALAEGLAFAEEVVFEDFPEVLQNVPRWYFWCVAAIRGLFPFATSFYQP